MLRSIKSVESRDNRVCLMIPIGEIAIRDAADDGELSRPDGFIP